MHPPIDASIIRIFNAQSTTLEAGIIVVDYLSVTRVGGINTTAIDTR
jgi:hypothetical protein